MQLDSCAVPSASGPPALETSVVIICGGGYCLNSMNFECSISVCLSIYLLLVCALAPYHAAAFWSLVRDADGSQADVSPNGNMT